jgi:hypothetical protein
MQPAAKPKFACVGALLAHHADREGIIGDLLRCCMAEQDTA